MSVESILQINVQFISFIVFCILFSFFLAWFERKIVARMQNRVGPPMAQPVIDFLKLSAKEDIYSSNEGKLVLHYTPIMQLIIILTLLFLVPIIGNTSFIHFEGDLFLYITLFALSSALIFIIASVSKSPYTLIGGNRSIITEISLEIPLIIAFASLAVFSGSLEISTISDRFLTKLTTFTDIKDVIFPVIFLILFIIIILSYLGALELNPFSTAKAETEIVGGWKTELTGKNLAVIELAEHVRVLVIASFIATIFLGNSFSGYVFELNLISILLFFGYLLLTVLKILVVTFILMFFHNVSARSRITTIADNFWFLLVASTSCLVGIITLEVI